MGRRWTRTERWMLVLVVAALAVLAAVHYARSRRMPPMGSGRAGPPVPAEPFQRAWHDGAIVLLGLGDSVTRGFGASPERSYFDLLVRNDDEAIPDVRGRDLSAVFPKLRAENRAVNYSTSVEHVARHVPRLPRFEEGVRGVVVITSGGNDLLHPYGRKPPEDGAAYGCSLEQARLWQTTFRKRLRGIIDGVAERFPGGCQIFLANIYDPTDGVGDIENASLPLPRWPQGLEVLALWNQTIAEVCDAYDHVHLVDIHAPFLGHGIHCRDKGNPHYRADDAHYWYFENLEDPNDRGYDAIRRAFLLKMIEVLGTVDRDGGTQ